MFTVSAVARAGAYHSFRTCARLSPASIKYARGRLMPTVSRSRGLSVKADSKPELVHAAEVAVADASTTSPQPVPPMPELDHGSILSDSMRWILFASLFTGASIIAGAIATNELSERALADTAVALELCGNDTSLDEYIAAHGNAAPRAAFSARVGRALDRWFTPAKGRDHFYLGDQAEVTEHRDELADERQLSGYARDEFIDDWPKKQAEAWSRDVEDIRRGTLQTDALLFLAFPLTVVSLRVLLSVLARTPHLRTAVGRMFPVQSTYSSRSFTLATSMIRIRPSPRWFPSMSMASMATIGWMMLSSPKNLPPAFARESECSPSDPMEATSSGRILAFALSAGVWGNTALSITQRIKGVLAATRFGASLGVSVIRHIAGARDAWAALAVYPLLTTDWAALDFGPRTGRAPEPMLILWGISALAYSPGGVAFALAYAAAGPALFDAARGATFSAAWYPLLGRFRELHAAKAEERAAHVVEAVRQAKARHNNNSQ